MIISNALQFKHHKYISALIYNYMHVIIAQDWNAALNFIQYCMSQWVPAQFFYPL